MRCAYRGCGKNGRCKLIFHCLEIIGDNINPFMYARIDLFPEHYMRAAGFNQPSELRPQMSFIGFSLSLPGARKRLAWA